MPEGVVVLSHPSRWLPGESPVLAPLSPDGRQRRFSVASLLEDVVFGIPRGRSRLCPFVGLVAVGHA